MPKQFFEEPTEQSKVKARIVAKYFSAWANVVKGPAQRRGEWVGYIDLFAGPGRYEDGTASTPLKVLEQSLTDATMSNLLYFVFGDASRETAEALENNIAALCGVENLKHKPEVLWGEVNGLIADKLHGFRFGPTLFFVDPWGYKGVTLHLLEAMIRDWGCECILFFNFNRINAALSNPKVEPHMVALFGEERANELRTTLAGAPPVERQQRVLEEATNALHGIGAEFVLPFGFITQKGHRPTHFLIHMTKHQRGYEIMKDIMWRESTGTESESEYFAFVPADRRFPTLFSMSQSVDDLIVHLQDRFAGRTARMVDIYSQDNVGTPFVKRHYKDALLTLESRGQITCDPPAASRRQGTFSDDVRVTFPPKA